MAEGAFKDNKEMKRQLMSERLSRLKRKKLQLEKIEEKISSSKVRNSKCC